ADEVHPEWGDFDTPLPRLPTHAVFVDAVQMSDNVQAGLHMVKFERAAAERVRRISQHLESLAVDGSHPAQVARVVSADNEVCERHLFEQWRMQISGASSPGECAAEIRWDDDETETQRGKDRFRE